METQDVFREVVPSGTDSEKNATRIMEFRDSGKLRVAAELLDLWKKKPAVVSPPKNKKVKHDEDDDGPARKLAKTGKEDMVCIRNIMLQFFGKEAGLGDICNPGCLYRHIPVGQFNQATFRKAVASGALLFGQPFIDGGWKKRLEDAFSGALSNNRQQPLYTPHGNPITPKPAIGGGRGGRGRGGRGERGN